MDKSVVFDLEDVVTVTYCALDDALTQAGIHCENGKLIPRPGQRPDVDDREILCLAILQELLDFESDNEYHLWLNANPVMRSLFPRRLSRQNFADRRALLTPLIARLCEAFCELNGEGQPPFSSLTLTPLTFADQSELPIKSVSADLHALAAAIRLGAGTTE